MSAAILIVDDDPGSIQVLARALSDLGEVFVATRAVQAIKVARRCRPDVILLDASMPDATGFDVCSWLKADEDLAEVPVIFVTAIDSPDFEVSSFELGAADFISKPVRSALVRARVRTQLRIKYLADQLRRSASEDALTGLANRRRFDEMMPRAVQIARRRGEPLALAMVDIDHFKAYNDHYGHPGGDGCLRAVARVLRDACHRGDDLAARVGGEEFAIAWPQTGLEAAALLAGRVLDGMSELAWPHRGLSQDAVVTVSIGIAVLQPGDFAGPAPRNPADAAGALVTSADRALYEAKRAGRARACSETAADPSQWQVVLPGEASRGWCLATGSAAP